MTAPTTTVKKLYLMQLSAITVPIGPGRSIEMSSGCYLVATADGRHILIDSGMPTDGARNAPEGMPVAREAKNVLEHLSHLHLRPEDIDTVICTHFDIDHVGYHEHFSGAEFIVQRRHYELAKGGHTRYAGGKAHWDDPQLNYKLIDGDAQLYPGLDLLETSGHCIGHQSVLLRLPQTGPVLLAIDAAILQRTFTMERRASPKDEDEGLLLASTRKLLELVERETVNLVVFGHDGEQWKTLKRAPQFYE